MALDAKEGLKVISKLPHRERVLGAAFDSTGKRVITASYDGALRIWNTETGEMAATLEGERGQGGNSSPEIESVRFLPPGDRVVAAVENEVTIWDWQSEARRLQFSEEAAVTTLRSSKGGNFLATGNTEGEVRIRELTNGRNVAVPFQCLGRVTTL